ncbi:MAG: B12-binding domain-containing radical SAM protein [Candidatus Helarchaeota archaeon]|nr:B12-binding domain-containing radical SAM protein [Candidatus Helarchaeota archaeon]
MERVLLLNPPSDLLIYKEDRCQNEVDVHLNRVIRPPISLMGLASISEKLGFQTKIIDAPIERISLEQLKTFLKRWKPQWVIANVSLETLESDLTPLKIASEFGAKTIVFGHAPTINDREILETAPFVDFAIRGEPEKTFQELIGVSNSPSNIQGLTFRENNSIKRNKERPFIENLDELPFSAHHLIRNDLYRVPTTGDIFTTIQTSRGCLHRCTFCLSGLLNGYKVRKRSVSNIIEEIKLVVHNLHIYNFFFRADTFTHDKQWVLQLCHEILRNNLKITWFTNSRVDTVDREMLVMLKKAGCQLITFGVESGDPRILRYVKKGITKEKVKQTISLTKKIGILTGALYILGLPGDTLESIHNTIQFSKEVGSDLVEFLRFLPFLGTEAIKQTSPNIPPSLIQKLTRSAYIQYYIRPKMIFQLFRNFYVKSYGIHQLINLITVTVKTAYRLLKK